MEHESKPLAADEFDDHPHRKPGVASVHTRAIVTWLAIFPMAAAGMTALGYLAPEWPPVLKALVLTVFVVPTAVYFAVPRLLIAHSKITTSRGTGRRRRRSHPTPASHGAASNRRNR